MFCPGGGRGVQRACARRIHSDGMTCHALAVSQGGAKRLGKAVELRDVIIVAHEVGIVLQPGRDERPRPGLDHMLANLMRPLAFNLFLVSLFVADVPAQFAGLGRVWVLWIQPRREPANQPLSFVRQRRVGGQHHPTALRFSAFVLVGRPDPAHEELDLRLHELRGFINGQKVDRLPLPFLLVTWPLECPELDKPPV
jgi:hypothetical protein